MLLQRFVKFIPVLPNKKWDEFIITENHFIWCTCKLNAIKNNNNVSIRNEESDSIFLESNNNSFEFFNISKGIQKIKFEDDNFETSSKSNLKENNLQNVNILRKLLICPSCIENIDREKCHAFMENVECSCTQFAVKQNVHFKLKMDNQLFSYFVTELKRCCSFRTAVINNLYFMYNKKHPSYQIIQKQCDICKCTIELLIASVFLFWPNHCIMDKIWSKRLTLLINEKCEVENAMSWLSTLGGAYSSLGDYFLHCAKQAEHISLQQFKLALKLGDPLTISRCKIYFAMSLVQQGYFTEAKRIIKKQYAFSLSKLGCLDFRLANMCKAIWNKLKYLESGDSLAKLHA